MELFLLFIVCKIHSITSQNKWSGDGISWWQSLSEFTPIFNTSYGTLQLRDALFMEFDIIFNGPIPSDGKWQNIFRVGFQSTNHQCGAHFSRYPSLWFAPNDNRWHFSVSDRNDCGTHWHYTNGRPLAVINKKEHIVMHYNDSHIFISISDQIYIDTFRAGTRLQDIGRIMYIWMSTGVPAISPFLDTPAANVTMENIIIVSYWQNESFTMPPTLSPSNTPTLSPTNYPSLPPTMPSDSPSNNPSRHPTKIPSTQPSVSPTIV